MLTLCIVTSIATWLAASVPAALVCGCAIALREAHEAGPRLWVA